MKTALELIRRLTLEAEDFGKADVDAARGAGLSDQAIIDAAEVCAMFNIIDRIADAMSFEVLSAEGFARGARTLRRFGYALPPPFRFALRRG